MNNNHTNPAFHTVSWPVNNVLAYTTTRQHPEITPKKAPRGNYGDFNLGLHVNDNAERVQANRQYLRKLLGSTKSIQWLDQVHGNDVAIVNEHNKNPYIADAAISRNPDIALAIMTADCLPILLTSQDGSEIAAIHGGWRPLSKGIIASTIGKMKTKPEFILAWLGPCIGPTVFEVGEEVKQSFAEKFNQAFTKINTTKYLANLQAIATIELRSCRVNSISALEHCTFSRTQEYYSYRREQVTGRMASIISLK